MKKHQSTALSRSGLMVALGVVILLLTNLLPFLSLSLTVAASMLLLDLAARVGFRYVLLAFLSTCLLAAILLPNKQVAAVYGVFFGAYTVAKVWLEGSSRRWLVVAGKLVFLHLSLAAFYGAMTALGVMPPREQLQPIFPLPQGLQLWWVGWLLLCIGFFLYDWLLSQVAVYLRTFR